VQVGPSVCHWCTRTSRRETRVACTAVLLHGRVCGAHRILERTMCCMVCGSYQYARVAPSYGDLPAILADLTVLVADLVSVDPAPAHLALATQLAAIQTAYLATIPMPPEATA
jgi:hypothetical protein